MSKIQLQHKILGLLLAGTLVPVLFAGWILFSARSIPAIRQVVLGLRNSVSLASDTRDLERITTELDGHQRELDQMDRAIRALQARSLLFLYGVVVFLPLILIGGFIALNNLQTPMRDVLTKLHQFQNTE